MNAPRPVTEEGLHKQITLMTAEMFKAIKGDNVALFQLAVRKGADVKACDENGLPLLHWAIKRNLAENTQNNWLPLVLPHVDDLFVCDSKGRDVFDPQLDSVLMPYKTDMKHRQLVAYRRKLMAEMPDLAEARAVLEQQKRTQVAAEMTLVQPPFNIVSKRQSIDKKSSAAPSSPKL